MKDFDIDSTIENADCEKKEQLRAQLHARIGLPQQQEPCVKSRPRGLKLKVALGAVGLCAVCLAIVLPISLRKDAPTAPSQNSFNYVAADFAKDNLGLTIKEYAEQTGKNILYLDWYDIADECVTTKYFLPTDKDNIIYIAEEILNGETGDHIFIDVAAENNSIDELDAVAETCIRDYEYKNTNIKWSYTLSTSRAYFEYKGYKYYLQLSEPMSEQAILDIIKEMF